MAQIGLVLDNLGDIKNLLKHLIFLSGVIEKVIIVSEFDISVLVFALQASL